MQISCDTEIRHGNLFRYSSGAMVTSSNITDPTDGNIEGYCDGT